MTPLRRLVFLLAGAVTLALAVLVLVPAAGTHSVLLLCVGASALALAVLFVGLALAPWGNE
jgi:NADH:ubiquinone oxidoreductase subunit 6 (subunit J)